MGCLRWAVISSAARAFPGGRFAHPEDQNEEENEKNLSKIKKKLSKFEERVRKVELLPTRDCEAGYGPGCYRRLCLHEEPLRVNTVQVSTGE